MNKPPQSFDLFAAPDEDHLQEQLAQGNFQWTNKFTKFLMVLVLLVGTLSLGAWYGHRSAAATGVSANGAPGGSAFFRNRGGAGGTLPSFGGTSGGGGGGFNRGTPGTVSKVTGNKVEITLPDSPTFKVGDTITVRAVTGGFGGGAPGAPGATSGTPTIPTTTKKGSQATTKPSVGGGNSGTANGGAANGGAPGGGGGRGGFNSPEFTACLKAEGVVIADGARPDRTDPKVADAMQKCFTKIGGAPGGFPGGRAGAPGAAPSPAPNN